MHLSIFRLHTLKAAVETTYPTWDDEAADGAATWQILELIMRNVCSCLPTLRPLVRGLFQSSELLIRQLALSDLRFLRELELMIAERTPCLRIAEERTRSYNIHSLGLIGIGAHYLALVYTRLHN